VSKFNSLSSVRDALDRGALLEWKNSLYKVHYTHDGHVRVSCKTNYFGSYLSLYDLADIYEVHPEEVNGVTAIPPSGNETRSVE
jgi:hypothetical protein